MTTSQCTSGGTWGEMEDSGVGYQKLLVARYNKGSRAVCGRV